eukprot:351505-Chlamydomonas_euryale.AAC.15
MHDRRRLPGKRRGASGVQAMARMRMLPGDSLCASRGVPYMPQRNAPAHCVARCAGTLPSAQGLTMYMSAYGIRGSVSKVGMVRSR